MGVQPETYEYSVGLSIWGASSGACSGRSCLTIHQYLQETDPFWGLSSSPFDGIRRPSTDLAGLRCRGGAVWVPHGAGGGEDRASAEDREHRRAAAN